jgi:predicted acetyltransferase
MADSQYYTPVLVETAPATSEQEPILANLLELYQHDFSEYIDLELGADGRFGDKYLSLSLYWKESGRYPFLIKASGRLAGFALVRAGSQLSGDEHTWDMAEFFIIRGLRRHGVGMQAAHDIWKRFPGRWEVRVIGRNGTAQEFWGRAIAAFIGKAIRPIAFEKDGELWRVFAFESK